MTDESATVLIVDDETNITALFEAWLDGEYAVRTANSGSNAIEKIDDSIDVALLDRRMPGISGDELLEKIRDRGLDVRTAMVTAVEPDFDVLEMGFDDYLTKPVARENLLDLVDTLESRKHYGEEIQEYYSLAAKKAALESSKPSSELVESAEYNELLADLDDVEAGLDGQLAAEDDFASAFQDL